MSPSPDHGQSGPAGRKLSMTGDEYQDDDASMEDLAASPYSTATTATATTPSKQDRQRRRKKRVRNFTDDDRAAHREFEKSRREAFKERLIHLAKMLPGIPSDDLPRLSKHVVVDESIAFIESLQETSKQLAATVNERNELLAEVNQFRSQLGLPSRKTGAPREPAPPYFAEPLHETVVECPTTASPDVSVGRASISAGVSLPSGPNHSFISTSPNYDYISTIGNVSDGIWSESCRPIPQMDPSPIMVPRPSAQSMTNMNNGVISPITDGFYMSPLEYVPDSLDSRRLSVSVDSGLGFESPNFHAGDPFRENQQYPSYVVD